MVRAGGLIAALLLAGCAYDPGGGINERARYIAHNPAQDVIRGFCASACTMRLKRDCVAPGAVLVFHGPQTDDPERFERFSRTMASHYGPGLRDWFMDVGRFGQHRMTGADLLARGWARACAGPGSPATP